jgi:hypothetical protein
MGSRRNQKHRHCNNIKSPEVLSLAGAIDGPHLRHHLYEGESISNRRKQHSTSSIMPENQSFPIKRPQFSEEIDQTPIV